MTSSTSFCCFISSRIFLKTLLQVDNPAHHVLTLSRNGKFIAQFLHFIAELLSAGRGHPVVEVALHGRLLQVFHEEQRSGVAVQPAGVVGSRTGRYFLAAATV